MDFNGMNMEGLAGIGAYPVGFMGALDMDERLMTGYNGLTESEKEELIFRYKDAKSDEEKQDILSALMPEEDSVRAVSSDDSYQNLHTDDSNPLI